VQILAIYMQKAGRAAVRKRKLRNTLWRQVKIEI